ncbi:aminotransferase class V-fold PLP-dependent enzyme [Aequorivita echinoideorum]|nr:aminotransferase class V-fold PLP-dependent enzyme [Aequorivita echinoideorum]
MEDLRKLFPALGKCIYVNTASNGLIPKPVVEWRREHDLQLMHNASEFRDGHKQHLDQIKGTISRFFGAKASQLALIPNFSFGMNCILEGLKKGQKILLLKDDYPSISWPVGTRDFNICFAEINGNLEQNIERAVQEHKPDVFIFSIVQWLNGVKIDFRFLEQLKSYHPNLLLVADGTQYLGSEKFNFSESVIDVLASSGYKWLTAGYGNGFLLVKEEARERIVPKTIGFNSAETFDSVAEDTRFMKHFEPGHQDTLNYGSLEQSLLFSEKIGVEGIYNQVEFLSNKAKNEFEKLGLLSSEILNRKNHSSIYNLKGDEQLFQKLKDENIICSFRGGGIRVSFHYYNTEADIDELVSILQKELR